MAITTDWQGNVRAFTFGAGTDWEIDDDGIAGLGIPAARTRDGERGDQDGDVGGDDTLPRRIIYVPLVGVFATPGDAWQSLEEDLKVGWAESNVDLPLDLRLAGMPTTGRRFFGRPREVSENLSDLKSGTIRALCTFEALDPLAYGDEVTTGPSAGTFTVTNAGTKATDRVTLTITGNGGIPRILNNTTDGDDVSFASAVTGTRVVDLRAHTILDGSGDDAYDELASSSLWFDLAAGANDLTLTGAASLTVVHRPAYR